MSPVIANRLFDLIPTCSWEIFALFVVLLFRKVIQRDLLPRTGSVEVPGFKVSFFQAELEKAINVRATKVSVSERSQVLRRAESVASLVQGAQILWVDDQPLNNAYETRILHSLGITVDIAVSTSEATELLARKVYDVIISDMERHGLANEGQRFLDEIRHDGIETPTIFYVGQYDASRGVPPYAFGMTDRPDQLLHYIMDVLERERNL